MFDSALVLISYQVPSSVIQHLNCSPPTEMKKPMTVKSVSWTAFTLLKVVRNKKSKSFRIVI